MDELLDDPFYATMIAVMTGEDRLADHPGAVDYRSVDSAAITRCSPEDVFMMGHAEVSAEGLVELGIWERIA